MYVGKNTVKKLKYEHKVLLIKSDILFQVSFPPRRTQGDMKDVIIQRVMLSGVEV